MRLSVPSCGPLLAAFGLATSLSLTSLSAVSATQDHEHTQQAAAAGVAQARQHATDLTQALMALQKHWANSQGAAKSRALEQIVTKAEERQTFLAELVKSDPAEVLRVVIPEEQQLGMPQEVIDLLEQKLEIAGQAEVLFEDYDDGSHKLRRFVRTPFGERFELIQANTMADLQNEESIRVDGVLLANSDDNSDGTLVTSEAVTAECCTQEGTTSITPPAGAYTFGEQKALVMLVNFQDAPQEPWTRQQAVDTLRGPVNDFYIENSGGQTWFSGDVTEWLTLPVNSSTCDEYGLASAAHTAAAAAGFDISAYQRLVYAFPKNSCGWSGLGSVGGAKTQAWLNGSVSLHVFAHELGHNLGLGHSGGLECETDIIEGSCFSVSYANRLDTMGTPNSGHFNAFQKERLGWLDQGLVTVNDSGSYALDPYEADGSAIKALKILQSTDAATGEQAWYYVEFRQAIGFDRFITESTSSAPVDANNILNGVVVTRGNIASRNSSMLLDMTPGTHLRNEDFKDPALTVGQRFTDINSGVEIQTNWISDSRVNVSVVTGTSDCVASAPSISLNPAVSDWVSAGIAVEYLVTLTNNDNMACGERTFAFTTPAPAGWHVAYSNSQLMLAPGESASSTLSVTSSADTPDGFYDLPVEATGDNDTVTANLTYIVSSTATNTVPLAVPDSADTITNQAVTIEVLANDSDADDDALTLESMTQGNHGTVSINSDQSLTYTPNAGYTGEDSFSYTISDGKGGNATATVSLEISAINAPPVATDDLAQLSTEAPVTIAVLNNDWDPNNDDLFVQGLGQPSKGSAQLNADWTITYTPAKSFKDSDSFTYTITDGVFSTTATVVIELASESGNGSTDGNSNGKGNGKDKP